MQRRDFITLVGGAASWPLAARAQQPDRMARIGWLGIGSASQNVPAADVFLAELRDLGYVEGRNLHVEFRFSDADENRLLGPAVELVGLNVDVIVTYANGVFAAQRATMTIPIVQAVGPDLVALGIVASLAHPGGNITGSTFFVSELMAKRLELVKEVVPSMTRAGVLLFRGSSVNPGILEAMGVAAKALGVGLQPIEAREPGEFENAFSAWAEMKVGALAISDNPQFLINADVIAALAAKHRLPSISSLEFAASGGLMAYGVNFFSSFRRAAAVVDKILKGAKPGDIPIERATKFKFVLNLKTAKALGLDIPPTLLVRADEVIE
jgi:putative ABC transport system substrate-binding protein